MGLSAAEADVRSFWMGPIDQRNILSCFWREESGKKARIKADRDYRFRAQYCIRARMFNVIHIFLFSSIMFIFFPSCLSDIRVCYAELFHHRLIVSFSLFRTLRDAEVN